MKMINNFSNIFKALAEPSRIRILKMLQVRPLCVCEISEVIGLTSSTVSEHLSILRENKLVTSEKKGKIVFYKLNFYPKDPSVTAINSIISFSMEVDKTIKSDKCKAKKVDCNVILARNNKKSIQSTA
jgi:DNA-binding transcriptional ArsR family regulator